MFFRRSVLNCFLVFALLAGLGACQPEPATTTSAPSEADQLTPAPPTLTLTPEPTNTLPPTTTPTQTATPSENINDYRVTNPGNVLIDPVSRRHYLEALGPEWLNVLCISDPVGASLKVVELEPIIYYERGIHDDTRWRFMSAMLVLSAEYLGTNNDEAAIAIIDTLKTWASANAFSSLGGADIVSTVYDVKELVTPMLVSYSLVRDHPYLSAEDQELIENWLAMIVRQIDAVDMTNNNHNYMRHAINMEWGALIGDDAYFQKGIEGYFVALGQMRPDGSFPLETARGAMATSYTSHAISSLVLMAEIAANQGYNLYDLEQKDLSLHSAITFLLDAIDDPEIIIGYAAANDTCTISEACRDYRIQHLLLHMGWIEPYRARFPESENTKRINQMFEDGVLAYGRRQVSEEEAVMVYPGFLDGAFTRCFYSKIETLPTPTQPPKREIGQLIYIYDDALTDGWDMSNWDSEVDIAVENEVHSGQRALGVTFGSQGGIVFFSPIDFSDYAYLEFYIKSGSQGGQELQLAIWDVDNDEGLERIPLSGHMISSYLPTDEWRLVQVSLQHLDLVNKQISININNTSDQSAPQFFLDDIYLVKKGTPATPTPTLSPEQEISTFIYEDTLAEGWDMWTWNGEADAAVESVVHSGQRALGVTLDTGGGIGFKNPLDFSQYAYLEFYINGGSGGGQKLDIYIWDAENDTEVEYHPLSEYTLSPQLPPDEWFQVRIPLQHLDLVNKQISINIPNASDQSAPQFFLDDIRLISVVE